ncbi:MAG: hypothetical protein KAR42_16375 [candidate division Zixibacteria bacterium]|nr:hypothetical protein [candidate division Zixibacteria bacterium]
MISFQLLLASLLWTGGALLAFELIWYFLEKKLDLLKKLPPGLIEEAGVGYFVSKFVMQFAFLVVVPTAVYSWFYVMVPFYGVRAGIAMALLLFIFGIMPFTVTILMRVKLPVSFILFQLAGYLLKLIMVYGIIGYLYIL